MKVAVVPNFTKKEAMACTEEVLAALKNHQCHTVLKTDLFDENGVYHETDEEELRTCDLFIAVGGDGTIIHTARLAASFDKPILGINAGTLGFTAALERDEISLLDNLFTGKYREEKRLILKVTVESRGNTLEYRALNDAVVTGGAAKIIDYTMALGENRGYHCRADGFIVATPTGSTAYSLSAGGPVIQPDMECLVYTPICSHALFSRSVVFGGGTCLTVSVPEGTGKMFLTVDGEEPLELFTGDKLSFFKSRRSARFVNLGGNDFYDVLNQKIIETR